jgi:voltage-gated potassium channel
VSTITTVGYGDHYPVTPAGRAIGIALMIAGGGIFGVVAASAAAWFISADQEQDRQRQADAINALTTELTALHQTVRELNARVAAQPPPRQAAPTSPGEAKEPSSVGADLLKTA